jgi:hypothetical protein
MGMLDQPSPAMTRTPQPSSAGAGGSFPSSAIIGIVIVGILLLFILVVFLAWRRQRRTRRQWIRGLENSLPIDKLAISEKRSDGRADSPRGRLEREGITDGGQLPTFGAYKFTSMPDTRANDRRDPTMQQTNESRSNMPTTGIRSPTKATVVNTFVTDLPDELVVSFGQRLSLLAEYDDGWTLCANEKGEQGMVPIECLAMRRKEMRQQVQA